MVKNDYDNITYYLYYYQFKMSEADTTAMGEHIENGGREAGKGQIMKGFAGTEGAVMIVSEFYKEEFWAGENNLAFQFQKIACPWGGIVSVCKPRIGPLPWTTGVPLLDVSWKIKIRTVQSTECLWN